MHTAKYTCPDITKSKTTSNTDIDILDKTKNQFYEVKFKYD